MVFSRITKTDKNIIYYSGKNKKQNCKSVRIIINKDIVKSVDNLVYHSVSQLQLQLNLCEEMEDFNINITSRHLTIIWTLRTMHDRILMAVKEINKE